MKALVRIVLVRVSSFVEAPQSSKICNLSPFSFLVSSDEFGIPHMVGFTTWFAMCPLKG